MRRKLASAAGYQPADDADAQRWLSQKLQGDPCLIVLDDVWRSADVEHLLGVVGARARFLVTTRNAGLFPEARSHKLEDKAKGKPGRKKLDKKALQEKIDKLKMLTRSINKTTVR